MADDFKRCNRIYSNLGFTNLSGGTMVRDEYLMTGTGRVCDIRLEKLVTDQIMPMSASAWALIAR